MSNFEAICESMKAHGMKLPSEREMLNVKGARQAIWASLRYFIAKQGGQPVWLPEYDRVAAWLENNEGKGLLMFGGCGLGKTILGMYVIPSIILAFGGKVVKCYDMDEMNRNPDEAKSKRFVYLDDIGTESVLIDYGNKRAVFAEIMDNAEKNGNLVIVSTNLDREGLENLYGSRVIDRIRSTMMAIPFNGKSMRGNGNKP